MKLGSQIFIKHMTDSGLAAKEGTLQEGDLILKVKICAYPHSFYYLKKAWTLSLIMLVLFCVSSICEQINGMTTENLSLLETKHLVEKSRGRLTMTVLRDDRKFLVSIPEVEDSAPNSEEDRRRESSSELEGKVAPVEEGKLEGRFILSHSTIFLASIFCVHSDISDIDEDITPRRAPRQPTREKRTRRYRPSSSERSNICVNMEDK